MLVFVMYYIYVTSGSSLLIESTDSMISQRMYISLLHLKWPRYEAGFISYLELHLQ